MPKVVTMILAGGQGSRLYPLTKFRSKPAVPIGGRFRLIDIPISNCIHSGFKRIYVCTQFAAESLHRHIFMTYRFSMFSKDFITILSAQQTLESKDWYQGTADAVRQNLGFLERYGDYVLILSGDHLYRMDYRKFVDFHIENNADISISVIPIKKTVASEFGLMKVDAKGTIRTFTEKPKEESILKDLEVPQKLFVERDIAPEGRTHLASMGIYIFNKDLLFELLEETTYRDFGREVIPFAIKERKVSAYFFDDYWEDIGTISAFFDAHMDLTKVVPKFNFYDEDRPIFTHPRFLPGAKLINAKIDQSLLCEGSIVNPSEIRDSIIGIRSVIGKECLLNQVIMMGADYFETSEEKWDMLDKGLPKVGIGNKCEIRRAIIDKNARIGHNCKLVNERNIDEEEGQNYMIRDGIIIIPKDAVIYDNTVI
jgi:glucose-1-phosphate adenylyltransferase